MSRINKPIIYYAGAIKDHIEHAREWRNKATKLFHTITDNVYIINPCHYFCYDMDLSDVTDKEVKYFLLKQVRECDIVLLDLKYPKSEGTTWEIAYAEIYNKPIIAFNDNDEVYSWNNLAITKKFKELKDAVEYICTYYLPSI